MNLEKVINDRHSSTAVRAAALFMSLMHPKTTRTLRDSAADLVNLYTRQSANWYFKAAILLVTIASDSSANAWFIGLLLERVRTDYLGRQELQRLLTRWREDSSAPIHTANVRADWLATA